MEVEPTETNKQTGTNDTTEEKKIDFSAFVLPVALLVLSYA